MAKTNTDIAPPESLGAPNTMSVLKVATQSAKPPTAKYTSSSLPQNKKR